MLLKCAIHLCDFICTKCALFNSNLGLISTTYNLLDRDARGKNKASSPILTHLCMREMIQGRGGCAKTD